MRYDRGSKQQQTPTCATLISSIGQPSRAITAFHATLGVDTFAVLVATAVVFRTLVHI